MTTSSKGWRRFTRVMINDEPRRGAEHLGRAPLHTAAHRSLSCGSVVLLLLLALARFLVAVGLLVALVAEDVAGLIQLHGRRPLVRLDLNHEDAARGLRLDGRALSV